MLWYLLVDMLVVLCRAGSVLNSQVAAWVGESNPTSRKLMYRAVKQLLLPSGATQARREITVKLQVESADSLGRGRQLRGFSLETKNPTAIDWDPRRSPYELSASLEWLNVQSGHD